MRPVTTSPGARGTLERADRPWEPNLKRGFFTFARTHFGGLSLHFWVLMIYLFLALSYLDEYLPSLEKLRPRSLLGLFALLVAIGRSIQEGMKKRKALAIERPQTFWLAAFVVSCTLSALFAFEPDLAQQTHIDHVTMMLSYFLLVSIIKTRRELLLTLLVMCAGVGTFLVLSFIEWKAGRYDYAQGVVRMMGVGYSNADPNSFGATIVFTLPLVIWAGVTSRSWFVRFCAAVYGALAVYSVFMSSSRSALVLTVLTAFWTLTMLRKGWPRLVGIGVFVAGGVLMVALLSPAQKTRILSIVHGETYTRESSTADRVEGYRVAFHILADNPMLGVGAGNWSAYRVRRIDGRSLLPHSLTGQIVATRGILGTVTFLGFLFSSIVFALREMSRRRRRQTRWDQAVGSLCWTCLFALGLMVVSGLAAHNLERANWYWLPALMIIASTARNEDWEELRETSV
ncbi:MAG: O-antigen ligase family protein [Planctomycetes bacterium]|nr:O-antigen ligase family protein [Planctomycetota bacterium]MCB9828321.1 O-antigen ligase family protein [Planctomycetota bacterium]MCB9899710.1 O-antigen ligase family protein [Planctomycetota bacterium]